jgi:polar amino acid transport system substrate-binding protein
MMPFHSRSKLSLIFAMLVLFTLALSACTNAPEAAGDDPLAAILERGTLVIATDPAYPPQSSQVEGAQRPADTKCTSEQLTAAELTGFDIDTAVEIAKRIGVEACFMTPDWEIITAGNWSGRWDVSVGSMTITPERLEKLYFTQPYYTTPAAFFVHRDNTSFAAPSDLSGKKIGACSGCTYQSYLDQSLVMPGVTIDFVVDDAEFVGYETDTPALQDLALGDGLRLDAVLTAEPTGQGAIENGLPLKQLGDPVYFEYLSAAVDKASTDNPKGLVDRLTQIIKEMHSDGFLSGLSQKYYGLDLTSAAGTFDLANLNQ